MKTARATKIASQNQSASVRSASAPPSSGKSRIGIATANVAVRAREPGLLHVALRFLPLENRPERTNGRGLLVHPDRMQPHLDMIAETRIVKTEHE